MPEPPEQVDVPALLAPYRHVAADAFGPTRHDPAPPAEERG